MSDKSQRDPQHLSELTVEDILNMEPSGNRGGKNWVMIQVIASKPGAVMVGKDERNLKIAEELAHEMGYEQIKFFGPDEDYPTARLENTDPILEESK